MSYRKIRECWFTPGEAISEFIDNALDAKYDSASGEEIISEPIQVDISILGHRIIRDYDVNSEWLESVPFEGTVPLRIFRSTEGRASEFVREVWVLSTIYLLPGRYIFSLFGQEDEVAILDGPRVEVIYRLPTPYSSEFDRVPSVEIGENSNRLGLSPDSLGRYFTLILPPAESKKGRPVDDGRISCKRVGH